MITAITYNNQHNRKYLSKENKPERTIYGEVYTDDLQTYFDNYKIIIEVIGKIIADLNKDLTNAKVLEIIFEHTDKIPAITEKTKKKRSYSIYGLTIHEEDK